MANIASIEYKPKPFYSEVYEFKLADLVLPITPASVDYKYSDNTEIITTANDDTFVIPHKDGLMEITFSFDIPHPDHKYPYENKNGERNPKKFIDKYKQAKLTKKPVNFSINRKRGYRLFDTSLQVIWKDLTIKEDASNGNDFTFNVTLLEYKEQHNQEIDQLSEHWLIQSQNARGWNR